MTCWRYSAAWTAANACTAFLVRPCEPNFALLAATIRFEVASPVLMGVHGPCPHAWYTCVHSALDPMYFEVLLLAMAFRYLPFGADDPPNGVSHGAACLFSPTFDVSPKCFAWSISRVESAWRLATTSERDKYAPICVVFRSAFFPVAKRHNGLDRVRSRELHV